MDLPMDLEPAAPADPLQSGAAASLVRDAIGDGGRSIHLQPGGGGQTLVRVRGLDGALVPGPWPALDGDAARHLIEELKRLAGLDPRERVLPQEGELTLTGAAPLTLRVATLPARHGEAVVLERLDARAPLGLSELGLEPGDLARLASALAAPGGLVLVTGPAGHGKGTLLRACLAHLARDPSRTIYSVPDGRAPDEPGVVMLQPRPELDLYPLHCLRMALRSDADVVHLAPPVKDLETSGVLVDAAMRGVLALSAMHAEDAVAAVMRLLDLGHERYAVAAALSTAVGVRVLRRLCDACKVAGPAPDEADLRRLAPRLLDEGLLAGWDDAFSPRRHGCSSCRGAGYAGQVGLYEVVDRVGARLEGSATALARLGVGAGEAQLLRQHAYDGVRTLRERAVLRAAAGELALVDALRSTPAARRAG